MMKADDYLYISDYTAQANKKSNLTCGDYVLIERTPDYTDFVLCDGMGSGAKANMSAIMCASRIITLMQTGISIYRACEKAVELMHRARTEDIPFAAFSVVRINKSGHYTSLSFEIPSPIIVKNGIAEVDEQRYFACAHEVVAECTGMLEAGDSLIYVSDGVSQAGLGMMPEMGWGIEGFNRFINSGLTKGLKLNEIADKTLLQTHRLSGRVHADDTTISVLSAKTGEIISLLTGPPENKRLDSGFVSEFMKNKGRKIICGSTTAEVAARELKEKIEIEEISTEFNQPPKYRIKGIYIVSEGAVTLNQVYNLLDVSVDDMPVYSVVGEIAEMRLKADVINIFLGDARNAAHNDISFKQLGIVERETIIKLIVEKLVQKEKVVKIIKTDMLF